MASASYPLFTITQVIVLESSAQKKFREMKDAQRDYYAGMAPTIVNSTLYSDCINAQIKV